MESDDHLMYVFKNFDINIVKKLSILNPWKCGFWILFQWVSILIAIITMMKISQLNLSWFILIPLYLLSVIWIGSRQHGLAIIMHDATHYRLAKNKTWNDVVSDLFLAWPLFMTTRSFREKHLPHHHYLNTDQDPDFTRKVDHPKEHWQWQFPMSAKRLAYIFIKDLLGLHTHELLGMVATYSNKNSNKKPDKRYFIYKMAYYLSIASLIIYFHVWMIVLLYWLIPQITWLKMLLRLRSIADHFAMPSKSASTASRTTYPGLLGRVFIATCNIWYQADHHLYPSVPFYNLHKLHKLLIKDPNIQKNMHITKGYWGVIRECVR
ncbi:MAG TPA: fatty acid desaturase family protein [Gammaproteobacteria bacterium]|nr:fatty acid desaturase family protein [Gammaproteobacteria bacterium]